MLNTEEPLLNIINLILKDMNLEVLKALNRKLQSEPTPKINNRNEFLDKIKHAFQELEVTYPDLLNDNSRPEWQAEKSKLISFFELNLVKRLIGFFKEKPETTLKTIIEIVPEDLRSMLENMEIGGNVTTSHP